MDQDLVDSALSHYRKTHHLRIYYDDKIFTAMWCDMHGEYDVVVCSDDMDEAILIAEHRLEKAIAAKLKKAAQPC